MNTREYAFRKTVIHILRSGKTSMQMAQELNRSRVEIPKWRGCFFAQGDWQAFQDQPRATEHLPKQLSEAARQAIRQARSELEAEVAKYGKLSYIDAQDNLLVELTQEQFPRLIRYALLTLESELGRLTRIYAGESL